MNFADINGGELILKHSELGVVGQWLETLVNGKEERAFWDYLMKMYNEGLSKEQEQSIEERRQGNKHLVPADFLLLIDIVFLEIIVRNLDRLEELGYKDIIVRAHIGGK